MKTYAKGQIYDSKTMHTVKIDKVDMKNDKVETVWLHYTNNPNYPKVRWGLEGKSLASFMKKYYLRKKK